MNKTKAKLVQWDNSPASVPSVMAPAPAGRAAVFGAAAPLPSPVSVVLQRRLSATCSTTGWTGHSISPGLKYLTSFSWKLKYPLSLIQRLEIFALLWFFFDCCYYYFRTSAPSYSLIYEATNIGAQLRYAWQQL